MSAEVIGWLDEDLLDHRRRLRNAMIVSLSIHGLVMAVFAVTPPTPVARLPEAISVELVAALPAAPRPKRAPALKAAPPPKATPPPPIIKAPVQVLPEEAPGRIREAKPEPEPVVKRPTKEKALSYEDAMAALDDELGVDETAELLTPPPLLQASEDSSAEPLPGDRASRPGVTVSPELAAWNQATRRLIQSKWVTPPRNRGRGLTTSLELRLSASGALIGKPRVVESSGDPYFDDNAVRALLMVAPLPPVAEPGLRIFLFRSEAD